MIIDVHNHVGLSCEGTLGDAQELLDIMDSSRIDKAILFTIDEKDMGKTYEPQNQKVAALVKEYPQRFIGVCRIQPKTKQLAIDEMNRANDDGIVGLKLHPKTDQFEPEDAEDAIAKAQELNWPVIIHTDHHISAQPTKWRPMFEAFPSVFFIMTHGGKDHWPQAGEIVRDLANVYLDTSTLSYNRTRMLLELAGPSNIVFGSDYPYSHPFLEKKKFELLVENPEDLDLIFFKNIEKIFAMQKS